MSLTAAEAWCWVAHLYNVEEDAFLYRYPRTEEDERSAFLCRKLADIAYKHAISLDPREDLWRRSIAKWDERSNAERSEKAVQGHADEVG